MLKNLMKKEKKLQKPYLKDDNLLIEHNLCQAHYQILLTILLKKLDRLSNLVHNLPEGIHKIKWKYGHNDKKSKTYGVKH